MSIGDICVYHYHSFPHFHFIHKPLIKAQARPDNVTSAASPLFGASKPPWGDSKSSKPNMRTAGCASEMPSDQFLTVCLPIIPDVFQVFIDKNTPPPVAYVTLDTWAHLEIPNWRSSTTSWNSFLSTGRSWPPLSVKKCKKSPSSWAYTINHDQEAYHKSYIIIDNPKIETHFGPKI